MDLFFVDLIWSFFLDVSQANETVSKEIYKAKLIWRLTFRFVSQLPVHKALPSADKPKQLIRFSWEFCKDPKFKTTCHETQK
jgi:hypothetical protein